MLLTYWLDIVADWRPAFVQSRLWRRAVAQALGSLMALGRRTLSRSLFALGHQHQDWSADYKLHARSRWNVEELFNGVLKRALPMCPGDFLAVAIDDTRLRKTGRHIATAFYQRDPLSPKFRFNLMWGLRFLQLSLLVPLYRSQLASPRGVPLRFVECPAVKRPGKKASVEQWEAYRQLCKTENLSQQALAAISNLRAAVDQAGAATQKLLIIGDNSFCNRTLFSATLDRSELVVRARKNIRLCRQAPGHTARFYAVDKFTPEQVRLDQAIPWSIADIFHGGQWRSVRYKEVHAVYWQSGARKRPLRLLVVGPIPYYVPRRGRLHHHQAAYVLTTELSISAGNLLQAYFDRWQIEVNHREEKDTLGVGQAQVRARHSVARQPAFVVAAYSALLLAGLLAYGPDRNDPYEPLPKWRRRASRPSCLDLLTVLRKQIAAHPPSLAPFAFHTDLNQLAITAAA